jgi:hypothetical protein
LRLIKNSGNMIANGREEGKFIHEKSGSGNKEKKNSDLTK